jgi:pyridoxamine 5'-phosphate oxidase
VDLLDLAAMRRQYRSVGIDEGALPAEPYAQFARWFSDVVAAELPEPNAMVVGTSDEHNRPSQRTVLLKEYNEDGFVFYTNYGSRKGRELAANPHVSLLFPWHAVDRQVIVLGEAHKITRERTAAYFHSRPRGSQLGAWASEQSAAVPDRDTLDKRYAEAEERFAQQEIIPVPDFWGGFRVVPRIVEFWQGRENRLHDRFRYEKQDGTWKIDRLSP